MATVYVLGTFDDPLEALTDFNGNALLIDVANTPVSDDEQTILDRDSDCGINDEIASFAPPNITAPAFAADDDDVLLQAMCGIPVDCPELDRAVIRSNGCNPPPNCILEPDALIAATAKATCNLPTFFPPRGTFEPPPDNPPGTWFPPDIPLEEVCTPTLSFITYSGSGTWCGFKGFFTFNDGITPRYLTKTIKGEERYYNYFPWGAPAFGPTILQTIRDWVASEDDTPEAGDGIQTFWSGSASYDPSDGCSLANGLQMYRRTNGNPYPFLTSYGIGPDDETSNISNAYVDDIWGFPPGFYGIVVTGYNAVFTGSPDERNYLAYGFTAIGNQLGSNTVVGNVRERLSNEHTMFDQLVIDGAQVSSTQQSSLVSFNDETGEFEGTLSAFVFVKPDGFNELGVRYTIYFVVNVTTGMTTTEQEVNLSYVGTGVADEEITVPLPVYLDSTVEFVEQCISVYKTIENTDGYETYVIGSDYYTLPAIQEWQAESDMDCGIGVSSDGYEDLPLGPIVGEPDCGNCWDGPLETGGPNELESYDGYEDYPLGPLYYEYLGFGWGEYGDLVIVDYNQSTEGYEDYPLGTITMLDSIEMWGGIGDIFIHAYDYAPLESYEDYSLGSISVLDGGEYWDGDGDITDI